MIPHPSSFFFFNDTATTEIYTLSLHDALPISTPPRWLVPRRQIPRHTQKLSPRNSNGSRLFRRRGRKRRRSEEHTSELQSHLNLVCRLLLEKKKKRKSSKMIEKIR